MTIGSRLRALGAALILSVIHVPATAGSGLPPTNTANPNGVWAQIPLPTIPPAVDGGTAWWDPVRGRMLVFGGRNVAGLRNEVWSLTPGPVNHWEQLFPDGTPPPARYSHTMVYDSLRDRLIVYGGTQNGSAALGDTWELRLSGTPTWSEIAAADPPPPRFASVAVYDPVGDRMIVHGGLSAFNVLADTWQLSLGGGTPTWTQIQFANPGLGARSWAASIYDPLGHRMLVFGGNNANFSPHGVLVSDTWALSLDGVPAWSQVVVGAGLPRPRRGHSAMYDPARKSMVIFGGWDGVDWLSDAAELKLDPIPTWSHAAGAITESPMARERAMLVYDPIRAQGIVFGGAFSGKALDSGWSLDYDSRPWFAHLEPAPTPRNGNAAVYDPVREELVVFGGKTRFGSPEIQTSVMPDQDTWSLQLDGTAAWHILDVPGSTLPEPRDGPTLVRDPAHDRLLMFGGIDFDGVVRNDVWTFDLATRQWAILPVLGVKPPGRLYAAAAFDPVRSRLFVFSGGDNLGGLRDDLWELDLESVPQWTQLTPSGARPIPRFGPDMIYDPVRDRMLMFGGFGGPNPQVDTWALSLHGTSAWTLLAVTGSPTPADGSALVYDSARDRLLVFGGGFPSLNTVFALSLSGGTPRWTQLAPSGDPPPPRSYGAAIYDVTKDRMVILQGQGDHGFVPQGDAWMLKFAEEPTPTLLAFADEQVDAGTVRLTWYTPDGAGELATAYRSANGASWDAIAQLTSVASGEFVLVDRVPAGGRFAYRLGMSGANDPEEQFTDGHWVTIPSSLQFALGRVSPNPSLGELVVEFRLAVPGPASLDVVSVSGRRVLHRDLTGLEPGDHSLRLAGPGELAPGMYLLRLAQGAKEAVAKIAVVR